jgi:hypothetical protein
MRTRKSLKTYDTDKHGLNEKQVFGPRHRHWRSEIFWGFTYQQFRLSITLVENAREIPSCNLISHIRSYRENRPILALEGWVHLFFSY